MILYFGESGTRLILYIFENVSARSLDFFLFSEHCREKMQFYYVMIFIILYVNLPLSFCLTCAYCFHAIPLYCCTFILSPSHFIPAYSSQSGFRVNLVGFLEFEPGLIEPGVATHRVSSTRGFAALAPVDAAA